MYLLEESIVNIFVIGGLTLLILGGVLLTKYLDYAAFGAVFATFGELFLLMGLVMHVGLSILKGRNVDEHDDKRNAD